ncbi:MAG: RNA 2',3'-cyclic phosphodiesterase [Planctomycetota bacterium]|nr:RNA 2',3'-cyclic phosphodiesterase [Planctomycetota bacterium]MCX8039833.1 RNA 2',3'-cyclic phosphodiesterase [Planctomycetota bacterium]MDW8372836.1 RNA 2',3'-cyclic phosphodiesterase [Planctomycetota bacterium]
MAVNHFFGLRPDAETVGRLQAISERLQRWELPARWTHPADYHLTLVFLGALEADEARSLPAAVAEVAESAHAPRDLQLCGLGAAGRARGPVPRAVYAAVADPHQACDGLRQDLCAALGVAPEPRFRPHITLCRPSLEPARLPLFRDWPHLLEAHGIASWGQCRFEALVLWASDGTGAARYRALAQWSLL